MAELTLIQSLPQVQGHKGHRHVILRAERSTLAKRRWRGTARNGRDFGFDLDAKLTDGTVFHVEDDLAYVIEQLPEDVIEIAVSSAREAGAIGWKLGNLHLPAEAGTHYLRAPNDAAVLQMLDREHLPYRKISAVFLPIGSAAHHHHHHD
jgi:urease accessory protein